jgi:hypothetical protein
MITREIKYEDYNRLLVKKLFSKTRRCLCVYQQIKSNGDVIKESDDFVLNKNKINLTKEEISLL